VSHSSICDRRAFLGMVVLTATSVRWLSGQSQGQLPDGGPTGRLADPDRAGRPLQPIVAADNDAAIQQIEKQLGCTCGCGLDIYTCRTTDFSCTYSPALHKQVVTLAQQGLTGEQIIAAFVQEHGVKILMAPPRRGFNLIGYFFPGTVILVAGFLLAMLLRRWARGAERPTLAASAPGVAASPAELEQLRRELEHFEH
jgi:cytochrome c-type biogenesis protein CcmH/NrfF